MNRFTKVLAVLLAVVWLPTTSHCDLGKLPGLKFLGCCDHPGVPVHQDEDCQQDSCVVVESGNYKIEEQPAPVPAPRLLTVFLPPLLPNLAAVLPANFLTASAAPPELQRIWHFTLRTALPPRAPSPLV